MSASAVITLDTQAPELAIGGPVQLDTERVAFPIEVDESAVLDVLVTNLETNIDYTDVDVEDDRIIVSGLPQGNYVVRADVYAEDSVGNVAQYIAEFPLTVVEAETLMGGVTIKPLIAAEMTTHASVEGLWQVLRPEIVAEMQIKGGE